MRSTWSVSAPPELGVPDLSTVHKKNLQDQIVVFRKAFAILDADGDGTITTDELAAHIETMAKVALSSTAINRLLQDMDVDHSGGVDFDEFCDFFSSRGQSRQLASAGTWRSLRSHAGVGEHCSGLHHVHHCRMDCRLHYSRRTHSC
mmetsp:Transcript_99822/g.229145  ORF Transcript_99822/g.229145 Transcript_99822/m.229145 type:complete len:147 (+) Transcript_99822:21-461(+)